MPRLKYYAKPQPPKLTAGGIASEVGEEVAEQLGETQLETESPDLAEEVRALRATIEELIFVIKLTNGL